MANGKPGRPRKVVGGDQQLANGAAIDDGKTGGSNPGGNSDQLGGAGGTVDLASVTPAGGDGSGGDGGTANRKPRSDRGRPRGPRKAEGSISLGGFKAIILDTHLMLATIAKAPQWALEDDEAGRLAETFGRVSRWYDIPEVGEKAADHYAFFMAIAMVYGTRLFASAKASKTAVAAPQSQPAPSANPNPAPVPLQKEHAKPGDPRAWSKMYVEGIGEIDVPPLAGAH